MAGKSIEEVRDAQCAAHGKLPKSTSMEQNLAHIATNVNANSSMAAVSTKGTPIMLNGMRYFPEVMTSAETTNLTTHDPLLTPGDLFEYHAFVAVNDDLCTSVNWAEYSQETHDGSIDTLLKAYTSHAYSSSYDPTTNLCEIPFILDTGATSHISPKHSDFKMLYPTPPHPVKGIGDACVYMLGMGTVELTISGRHKICLDNVLFIPCPLFIYCLC